MKTLASAALLALTLASACTQEDTAPEDVANIVSVKSFAFEPSVLTVKAGDTVEWRWVDGTHNVNSGTNCTDDGKFRSGDPVEGATFSHLFDTPGTYEYFCEPHCSRGMVGKVIVQ